MAGRASPKCCKAVRRRAYLASAKFRLPTRLDSVKRVGSPVIYHGEASLLIVFFSKISNLPVTERMRDKHMTILFFKSVLSIVMLCLAVTAMFTMFEIFGRTEKRFDTEKLKNIHKFNGIIYFLIFIFIAYFCLRFIVMTKSELSTRGSFHSIFALTILVLFGVKISITRVYRQFYNQVYVLGLLMAIITFGLFGTSGGYYLLVTKFGTDLTFDKIMQYKQRGERKKVEKTGDESVFVIRTDPERVGRGKNLFDAKCSFCHDRKSTKTLVGPGLLGILKKPELPTSKKPATPENIKIQLRNPYRDMPSFDYLSDEDIKNIIQFLNTF